MDDAEAFAMFYADHDASVLAAVRATLRDGSLASDAVDEAFARAAERWRSVQWTDRPAAWTYRVAVNWATSWRRKWSLRPSRPVEELDRSERDDVPDVDLVRALAVLPLQQRQVLVLRHAFGCSVREVAQVLDIAEGTVKSADHRARQRLLADGWWHETSDEAGRRSTPARPGDGASEGGSHQEVEHERP